MKEIYLFVLFFISISTQVHSQTIDNYTPTRTTGNTYVSIVSTGTAFDSWRNAGGLSQDDNRSVLSDIGFDFWYNGVRYTQFSVSTNGFMDLSASTSDGTGTGAFGYSNAAFSTGSFFGTPTTLCIAPFYDDLTAQGAVEPLGNSIRYLVSGSAPNRVLTVEWFNMAIYGNTAPSLNFQVKIHETTGIIQMNYGTMNDGGVTFSYTTGINGPTIGAFGPTAAQLKTLQTANTNTFNATAQNGLSAMPASGSRYTFTPPTPTAVSGTLTFTGVTQTGMTLNWPNWAGNEIGYVIYNSTDNVNFTFVTQTAANATTQAMTGLFPGTTYYWRVYAVTEGCLSSPLSGTRATNAAGNKVSNASGNWNTAGIWTPSGVPTATDNVTISNTHTVTINTNAVCNNLIVGVTQASMLTIGNNGTDRDLDVAGTITINTGSTLRTNPNNNSTNSIEIHGNIINNGTINFAAAANRVCNATIQKEGNITISGTGATTTFNLLSMDMGSSVNNTLEITTPSFTAANNFLTLTAGTFKLSTSGASNITPFTGTVTIPQKGGVWLNSSASTISFGNTVTINGNLTNSNGTLNIGNAADEDLISTGGILTASGGTTNIAGKYYSTGINTLSKFNITGGTVIVPSSGSTNTTIAPFQIAGAGSQFTMTGGSLIIPREGGTGAQNLGFVNTGATGGIVSGGTLQIGNGSTPAGQVIQVNSTYPVANLLVNSANANATLLTNSLTVTNNITITTGTLTANGLNYTLGGNWANNGGTFAPGTGTVFFNGTSAQSIFKSGGETFNNLIFSNAGTKTLGSAVITTGAFTINSGSTFDVSASNYQVTVRGNFSNSGTMMNRSGNVFMNGTTAQTIGGTATTNFYDLTLNNNAGASLLNAENIINSLVLNNGTFNTNSQNFTLVSTASGTGRIAQITGTGDITGNVIQQRFAPGGYTGWAFLGTPITSALTYAAWDDDIPISCWSCPDGSSAGFLSIYTYNETVGGAYDNASAYVPINNINNPIVNGKGYWVYFGDGYTTTNNITLDVTGTVRKGNFSIPITRTNTGSPVDDGWNLISNPYPSPIRWSLLKGATAAIDNSIYVYNADLNGGTGSYATYINGISSPAKSAGGIGDTIPIGQGFYVHSTGATSLNGTEASKVGGNPTFLREINPQNSVNTVANPMIRLYLDKATGTTYHDETVLYIQAGAHHEFDEEYDAYKLVGGDYAAPAIALQYDEKLFQVNGVEPITNNFSMPLKTTTGYPGSYTISAEGVSSFPQGACINLYDTYTGVTTDLSNASYTFSLSDTTVAARFSVTITINPLQVNSSIGMPVCQDPDAGHIVAIGDNAGPWNYYWQDSNGAAIRTSLNKTTADTLSGLPNGDYTLIVNTVGMCDNSTTQYTINAVEIPVAQFSSVDTIYLGAGGTIDFTNNSSNGVFHTWDFGDGTGSASESPSYVYTTAGQYTVNLVAESATGCYDSVSKTIVVIDNVTGLSGATTANGLIVKTTGEGRYQLQQKLDHAQLISFRLTDALGKTVNDFGAQTSDKVQLSIDLSGYESGIYYLRMLTEEGAVVIKLLKS